MGISTKNNLYTTRQRGFSIIELMIALSLGLLVLFAVLQVFTASLQSANLQSELSRIQENGRMSMQMISRDIRGADFWGCLRDTTKIVNHLKTTDPDYKEDLVPTGKGGVAGENDVSSKTIATIAVKDATDTLTLRSANSISNATFKSMNMNAASIQLNSGGYIPAGSTILIGDCTGAELVTITNSNTSNSTVVHNTGTVNIAYAVENETQKLSREYTSALIMTPSFKTYFIGKNPAGGDSLYRSDDGIANELVRGVTELQLFYNNGSNNYVPANTSGLVMDSVRAIRVVLKIESGDASSASPLERTYTVTVNIRNRTL